MLTEIYLFNDGTDDEVPCGSVIMENVRRITVYRVELDEVCEVEYLNGNVEVFDPVDYATEISKLRDPLYWDDEFDTEENKWGFDVIFDPANNVNKMTQWLNREEPWKGEER